MVSPPGPERRLPPWSEVLARPLEAAYAFVAGLRRRASRRPGSQRRLRRPVVSVGNLVVGGAGKTPVVAHVATLLRDAGHYPAVLSRGYGRSSADEGVVVVRDAHQVRGDLPSSGDEPLMLAERLPGCAVVVGADRHLAGVLAESRLGCTVHLLDDGFQHLALARDVDLLLVSAADLAGERVLPAGRLREAPRAARLADAWLVDPSELAAVASVRGAPIPQVFSVVRRLGLPVALATGSPVPGPEDAVVLVSGVARPARVEDDARRAGWRVRDHVAFPDHRDYDERDVRRILARARDTGAAAVLTTEKDAVKLRSLGPFPVPVGVLPLELRVEPADAFRAWLLARLASAAPARGAR